ncbi:hypothetical protein GWI33_015185 [Rhynchophorus ferrugineus]|uniref:Uncharacterized protein n=1 Tax=Rhynchophorus ferrugineus TaxID=354439 RepID=A0A834I089_RHYFE|nr:hypothetical protein GWI33_015185 [Rhynchophorus ferrugineus]
MRSGGQTAGGRKSDQIGREEKCSASFLLVSDERKAISRYGARAFASSLVNGQRDRIPLARKIWRRLGDG